MSLAVDYVKSGMALVAIPSRCKAPVQPGWNLPENAITTIDAAAEMHGNVGILHAYSSPRTVSIDIDDLDAATQLLDVAGIDIGLLLDAQDAVQISSGRPNRAKLLYRLPEFLPPLETIQIEDPVSGAMVIEIRSASREGKSVTCVLPPSIHPKTEKEYTWAGRGHWSELPELPPILLEFWKGQLQKKGTGQKNQSSDSRTNLISTLPDEAIQHLRSALLHMRSDNRTL